MSVPNQKVLTIIKPPMSPPFLQIYEKDWMEAFRTLSPSAFGVYLYLAQNADGYRFEYSPTAIENTQLMSKGTATKARQELERAGYISNGCFYVENPNKRAQKEAMNKEIKETTGK